MGNQESVTKGSNFVELFTNELKNRGHRLTNQRVAIAEIFAEHGGHLTVDALYRKVFDDYPDIGYATVYRTLRLLVDCGLAEKHQFDLNKISFEVHDPNAHHDHLICVGCRKIIEFENDHIEALQEEVARQYNFVLQDHRMELYGICQDCQKENK